MGLRDAREPFRRHPVLRGLLAGLRRTWSAPQMLPFALHRPYAKQLPDGRVLVTGRHVNGGLGTFGWVGDLRAEAGRYAVGGPRTHYRTELSDGALRIESGPGLDCRYTLLPPESALSEVHFTAEVRVESTTDDAVAFLSLAGIGRLWSNGGLVLSLGRQGIWLGDDVDNYRAVDMTVYRTVAIHHRGGFSLRITVDGQVLINQSFIFPANRWRCRSFTAEIVHGARSSGRRASRVPVIGGTSPMRRITRPWPIFPTNGRRAKAATPMTISAGACCRSTPTIPPAVGWPDHGYSSWVMLPDGRIMLLLYQPG